VPPLVRHLFTETTARTSWLQQVRPHMFGHLPSGLSDLGESR
jgi:xanthosine utilization system XapX-like protein